MPCTTVPSIKYVLPSSSLTRFISPSSIFFLISVLLIIPSSDESLLKTLVSYPNLDENALSMPAVPRLSFPKRKSMPTHINLASILSTSIFSIKSSGSMLFVSLLKGNITVLFIPRLLSIVCFSFSEYINLPFAVCSLPEFILLLISNVNTDGINSLCLSTSFNKSLCPKCMPSNLPNDTALFFISKSIPLRISMLITMPFP